MIILDKNYVHKYTESKKVYCITSQITKIKYTFPIINKRPKLSIQNDIYSVPYISENGINTNVILGFINEQKCYEISKSLNVENMICETTMDEFKEFSNILHLPIVVIIDTHNDNYDIYFKDCSK